MPWPTTVALAILLMQLIRLFSTIEPSARKP
jgi:hypothetical protein